MNRVIIPRHVVAYAAQECAWQKSGELSVAWMIDAWCFAHRFRNRAVNRADILVLGLLIEPKANHKGLRTVGVRVGHDVKMDPALVPEALDRLIAAQPSKRRSEEINEWFRQYEEIHPFRDGNGRTGTLLYNWLRGTLPYPVHVPNLWNDPRRGPQ